MVIDSNSNIPPSAGNTRNRVDTRPAESGPQAAGKEAQATNDVSLSDQAKLLSKLESQMDTSPDVDSERVAKIRQALAAGTYEIDAERIAERMLDQDQLFRNR